MFHFKGFCVNSNPLNLHLFIINSSNGSTYIGAVQQHVQ